VRRLRPRVGPPLQLQAANVRNAKICTVSVSKARKCSRCVGFRLGALRWPTCPLSTHYARAWCARMPPLAVADVRALRCTFTQSELRPTRIVQPAKPSSRANFAYCHE
jgi:hypothetical protein